MEQWAEELGAQQFGVRTLEALRPVLGQWKERRHGSPTFRRVQVLSRHGCFGSYLHRIRREATPSCLSMHCGAVGDMAQHTLEECSSWSRQRHYMVMAFAEYDKLDDAVKLSLETIKQKATLTPAENAMRQLTLQQSLQVNDYWNSAHHKSQEMDRTIAEMIALQNLPFNFVEGTGFRRVMNTALPKYKMRGREFFSSYVCDNLYHRLAKKTKDLLQEFDKLSFTSDIWSELHSAVSLLSVTAHGISTDFRKMTIILKCEVMDERHTGTIISTKF
ncbi:hypothetical protein evm_004408 [Chilo suppressalis]|nr:hypothetical protein evm_004408 [Chilo suppressalis]